MKDIKGMHFLLGCLFLHGTTSKISVKICGLREDGRPHEFHCDKEGFARFVAEEVRLSVKHASENLGKSDSRYDDPGFWNDFSNSIRLMTSSPLEGPEEGVERLSLRDCNSDSLERLQNRLHSNHNISALLYSTKEDYQKILNSYFFCPIKKIPLILRITKHPLKAVMIRELYRNTAFKEVREVDEKYVALDVELDCDGCVKLSHNTLKHLLEKEIPFLRKFDYLLTAYPNLSDDDDIKSMDTKSLLEFLGAYFVQDPPRQGAAKRILVVEIITQKAPCCCAIN